MEIDSLSGHGDRPRREGKSENQMWPIIQGASMCLVGFVMGVVVEAVLARFFLRPYLDLPNGIASLANIVAGVLGAWLGWSIWRRERV